MKKIIYYAVLILITFYSSQKIAAQNEFKKGTHELQTEEFGNKKLFNDNIISRTKTEEIIGLNKSKSSSLNKMVFGFLPYWEQAVGAHDNIRYDLLTHLACFSFLVKLDASITTPPGWPWTTEINAAHAQGVKVIMTVVNFGGNDGADAVAWEMITNTVKQTAFFNNIKNIIQTYNLDGVNIDFEGMTSAHRGAELNTFMLNLKNYIHSELPGKEVSFDGPAVNWGGWDISGLVNSVDYLIIMAYDYISKTSTNSGPVAPLTHPTSWKRFVKRTIETGTYKDATTNSPQKLVLAVPYYGQHWKTSTGSAESTTTEHIKSTRFRDTAVEVSTYGGYIWDNGFQYPWYKWNDGTNWNQVWADNEESISKKYDLAITNNLGGIGIWALNYDGTRPELWNLINTKFNATASLSENAIKKIKIYPNPFTNFINISNIENSSIKSIEIKNITGASILKISDNFNKINLEKLSKGIYIVKIEDEYNDFSIHKILKTK